MADSVRPVSRHRQKISADASLLVQNVHPKKQSNKKDYVDRSGYEKFARPKSRRQQYRDTYTPSRGAPSRGTPRTSQPYGSQVSSQPIQQSMKVQSVQPQPRRQSQPYRTSVNEQDVPERPKTSRGHRESADYQPTDTSTVAETPRPRTSRGSRKENIAPAAETPRVDDEGRPKTGRGRRQHAGLQESLELTRHEPQDWEIQLEAGQVIGTATGDEVNVWHNPVDQVPNSARSENTDYVSPPETETPRPSSRRLRPKSAKGRSRPPCSAQDRANWSVNSPGTNTPRMAMSPDSTVSVSSPLPNVDITHQTMSPRQQPASGLAIHHPTSQHTSLSESQRLTYEWQQNQVMAAAASQQQGYSTPRMDPSISPYAPLPAIGGGSTPLPTISGRGDSKQDHHLPEKGVKDTHKGKVAVHQSDVAHTPKADGVAALQASSLHASATLDSHHGNKAASQQKVLETSSTVPAQTLPGGQKPVTTASSHECQFLPLTREVVVPAVPIDEPRVLLAVKLPTGQRVERYFHPSNKMEDVLAFAEVSSKLDLSGCLLASSVPAKTVKDLSCAISETGFENKTVLHIQVPNAKTDD